jgi:hypothetical protein
VSTNRISPAKWLPLEEAAIRLKLEGTVGPGRNDHSLVSDNRDVDVQSAIRIEGLEHPVAGVLPSLANLQRKLQCIRVGLPATRRILNVQIRRQDQLLAVLRTSTVVDDTDVMIQLRFGRAAGVPSPGLGAGNFRGLHREMFHLCVF